MAGQSIPEYVDRTSKHDRATSQREKTEVQINLMNEGNKQESVASIKGEIWSESKLRSKLKNMCNRPKREIVKFYDKKTDKSLYSMIKELAQGSLNLCQYDSCQK